MLIITILIGKFSDSLKGGIQMSKTRLISLIVSALVLLLPVLICAGTYKLPDTGQTTCYDTSGNVINCKGTGQDGAYNFNPLSYTDNNGTVTDNNTGLIWQKEDDSQT